MLSFEIALLRFYPGILFILSNKEVLYRINGLLLMVLRLYIILYGLSFTSLTGSEPFRNARSIIILHTTYTPQSDDNRMIHNAVLQNTIPPAEAQGQEPDKKRDMAGIISCLYPSGNAYAENVFYPRLGTPYVWLNPDPGYGRYSQYPAAACIKLSVFLPGSGMEHNYAGIIHSASQCRLSYTLYCTLRVATRCQTTHTAALSSHWMSI